MGHFLIDIGFLDFRVWDLLDILITGYLIFLVIRLLKGSIAFPIFVGLITLFFFWWIVNLLDMSLLSLLLGQFVSVGVIIVVIIFQPEIRRFLLFLGNSTLTRRKGNFLSQFFPQKSKQEDTTIQKNVNAIKSAMMRMSNKRVGALIVFASNLNLDSLQSSGVKLNADISQSLLISLFEKDSPLHDGAAILMNGKIVSASSILPVSENQDLPQSAGLRHRSAVGVTENTGAAAFVVSEETGTISYAYKGSLYRRLSEEELYEALMKYYN